MAAFDDQLIVNVTDDEAVPERFHSVTENVAADGLDDILHELGILGFDTFPLFCGTDFFIGYRFAVILVCQTTSAAD